MSSCLAFSFTNVSLAVDQGEVSTRLAHTAGWTRTWRSFPWRRTSTSMKLRVKSVPLGMPPPIPLCHSPSHALHLPPSFHLHSLLPQAHLHHSLRRSGPPNALNECWLSPHRSSLDEFVSGFKTGEGAQACPLSRTSLPPYPCSPSL